MIQVSSCIGSLYDDNDDDNNYGNENLHLAESDITVGYVHAGFSFCLPIH